MAFSTVLRLLIDGSIPLHNGPDTAAGAALHSGAV
jgi:hypothetical protein